MVLLDFYVIDDPFISTYSMLRNVLHHIGHFTELPNIPTNGAKKLHTNIIWAPISRSLSSVVYVVGTMDVLRERLEPTHPITCEDITVLSSCDHEGQPECLGNGC